MSCTVKDEDSLEPGVRKASLESRLYPGMFDAPPPDKPSTSWWSWLSSGRSGLVMSWTGGFFVGLALAVVIISLMEANTSGLDRAHAVGRIEERLGAIQRRAEYSQMGSTDPQNASTPEAGANTSVTQDAVVQAKDSKDLVLIEEMRAVINTHYGTADTQGNGGGTGGAQQESRSSSSSAGTSGDANEMQRVTQLLDSMRMKILADMSSQAEASQASEARRVTSQAPSCGEQALNGPTIADLEAIDSDMDSLKLCPKWWNIMLGSPSVSSSLATEGQAQSTLPEAIASAQLSIAQRHQWFPKMTSSQEALDVPSTHSQPLDHTVSTDNVLTEQ